MLLIFDEPFAFVVIVEPDPQGKSDSHDQAGDRIRGSAAGRIHKRKQLNENDGRNGKQTGGGKS